MVWLTKACRVSYTSLAYPVFLFIATLTSLNIRKGLPLSPQLNVDAPRFLGS